MLICDDHQVVRDGLSLTLALEDGFEVVGEAKNGAEAVEFARVLAPDVVLMDLQMPVMDGFEAIARIRETRPEARCLVLTSFDGGAEVRRALELGAAGYMLKDAPRQEVFEAIRRAARGEAALGPQAATKLVEQLQGGDARRGFTDREVEVLELLKAGKSNPQIAKDLHVGVDTVKDTLKSLNRKLGTADRTAAVVAAIRRKLISL